MINQNNMRVIFTDQAEDTFRKIAQQYGLAETDEEFDDYINSDNETREMILRDAVEVISLNLVPENRTKELLVQHLNISNESAAALLASIKTTLLPLLLTYPEENFEDPAFRESVLRKFSNEQVEHLVAPPIIKKLEVTDVEENAEKLRREGKGEKDTYREPIE